MAIKLILDLLSRLYWLVQHSNYIYVAGNDHRSSTKVSLSLNKLFLECETALHLANDQNQDRKHGQNHCLA